MTLYTKEKVIAILLRLKTQLKEDITECEYANRKVIAEQFCLAYGIAIDYIDEELVRIESETKEEDIIDCDHDFSSGPALICDHCGKVV